MKKDFAYAAALDAADPLAAFRADFCIPQHNGKEQLYFLGNSLGLPNRNTRSRLNEVLDQWERWGVEAFFMGDDPWLYYHDHLTGPMARIVGALPSEVVLMNQLTVNLHLLLTSFYRPQGKRQKILCEAKAFPSDQYMLETHVRQRGLDPENIIVELAPRAGETAIREEDILHTISQLGEELALVCWGGLHYYTGQAFDMKAITEAGHAAGAKVGFDLAHAAGNIPLQLHDWQVDFAAWCNYKYLNGGPGAIGGAFVHERYHNDNSLPRLAGWWGYKRDTRFLMEKGFRPETGAAGWQLSTPSALQYACLRASLDLFDAAGFERIVEKGRALSAYLLELLQDINTTAAAPALEILTPTDPAAHGCQVSLLMRKRGREIFEQLQAEGIFVDWREPNVIRLAPVPLYNRFTEVWQFADCLRRML